MLKSLPPSNFPRGRDRRPPTSRATHVVALALLAMITVLMFTSRQSHAQQPQVREYPSEAYYLCFRLIDEGDYVSAEKALKSVARGGLRTSDGPWVDSICYFAMLGECYYHMGDLGEALKQYTNALQVFTADSTWMLRVEFPAIAEAGNLTRRTPVTWGPSQRRTMLAGLPDRYPIIQGTTNVEQVLRQGGVLAPVQAILVNAHEIVRCTGLAIRRRAEIMGVACRHDPLTERLVAALTARPAPPNHWSQSWIDNLLGLAYLSAGRPNEAVAELGKGVQIGGQYDHPLSAATLVELGKLAMKQQQYGSAASMFVEATFPAAMYQQHDVMAEAFRWGTMAHLVAGTPGAYPPLEPAIQWARRERLPALEANLLIAQAQNAAELNETAAAAGLIDRARRAMSRSEMARGSAGARLSYVSALVGFQSANLAAGEAAWKDVAAYQSSPRRTGSLRLFEIGLVHGLVTSGRVTPRVANELYAEVLREPLRTDWLTDPVETLTTVIAPNLPAFEQWLNIALERDEIDRAVEIADRIRRLRFYSTLPLGGRLLALGWILEAGPGAVPESAILQRQDLLNRYPKYAELAKQSSRLRAELRTLPLIPPEGEAAKAQQKLWSEWAAVSQLQELMLREIAIRREPADFVFPPPLNAKQLQGSLTGEQVILAFLITSDNKLNGFLISKAGFEHWRLEGASRVTKEISELLKQYGQFDRNSPVDTALLTSSNWQERSGRIWDVLSNAEKSGATRDFTEMVIVPDRFLWYLPFESLQAGSGDRKSALLNLLRVRYAPTVSLAVPDRRPSSAAKDTLVIAGKLFSNSDTSHTAEAAAELQNMLSDVTVISPSVPAPSAVLSALARRTLVLHDSLEQSATAYDYSPMQLDRGKSGNSLGQWMALPWGAPEQMILPTFHSAAESAMRRGATGDDLFLTVCGLMASGSRTVLLSRWRTGGQTSLDLMREFVQELPYSSAANAWQRSVALAREKDLRIDREPRVKPGDVEVSIKADHPFFWAGYVLVDTGASPPTDEVGQKDKLGNEVEPEKKEAQAKKPDEAKEAKDKELDAGEPKAAGNDVDGEKPAKAKDGGKKK